jgi:FixJ family two-component response regulator
MLRMRTAIVTESTDRARRIGKTVVKSTLMHRFRTDGLREPIERSCIACDAGLGRVHSRAEWGMLHRSVDSQDHVVFIVDDDRRIREALCDLLSSFDMHAVPFGSAAEYMTYPKPEVPACLVLDVHLPDINGLDLQSRIGQGDHPHIVFITGQGDIPSSVRAMKAGAVDFLTKPFSEADLMRAINAALAQNREARRQRSQLTDLHQRFSSLTPREREVLPLVVGGLLNKQAAAELGISEVTLQIHRRGIMKKMGAGSLAELVRMAGALEIPVTRSRRSPK